MFDLECYKHKDHKERQASKLSIEELCRKRPDERSLPFFSISVEQLDADEGYQSLNGTDQGDFLRLLSMLWKSNGLMHDFPKAIAKEIRLTEEVWLQKRKKYISNGLLEPSSDGVYLLNRELRQQYLNTLKTNNGRRGIK